MQQKFKTADGKMLTLDQVIVKIADFIEKDLFNTYEFTVGTDSQNFDKTKIVEVIAVHRVGKGGTFFYNIDYIDKIQNLRQKITEETQRSISIADGLLEKLELELINRNIDIDELDIKFQIHCDIGQQGKTKTLIREITNWVTGLGYTCLIKPDSYAASGIANKYSK